MRGNRPKHAKDLAVKDFAEEQDEKDVVADAIAGEGSSVGSGGGWGCLSQARKFRRG